MGATVRPGVAGDGGRLDDGMVFRLAHGGVAVAAFDQGGRGAGALLVFVHFQQGGVAPAPDSAQVLPSAVKVMLPVWMTASSTAAVCVGSRSV